MTIAATPVQIPTGPIPTGPIPTGLTREATTGIVVSAFFWLVIHILATSGGFPAAAQPVPTVAPMSARLSAALLIALTLGMSFRALCRTGWAKPLAALAIAILLGNAALLYGVTVEARWIPMVVALALVVPAMRHVEVNGDVQSQISFGLSLSVLGLVGVETVPLILPLAIVGALLDPDGRRDLRAFLSLCLVLILPSIILATSVILLSRSAAAAPYLTAAYWAQLCQGRGALDPIGILIALLPTLPVTACTIAAFLLQRRPNGIITLSLVILLPLYLVLGQQLLLWPIPGWMPAAAALATTQALIPRFQPTWPQKAAILTGLALTTLWSWSFAGVTLPVEWRDAVARPILTLMPSPPPPRL